MATAANQRRFTPREYLEFELRSQFKHEYFRGEIFQMSDTSRAHNLIATHILALIDAHLRGNPCEVYGSDMRVKVSPTGLYTYPDVSVACPPIEIERISGAETLTNPVVLIEVLSPSTEAYDRGRKFGQYAHLPSLREYVLVSQEEHRVDHLTRADEGHWKFRIHAAVKEHVQLAAIDCPLPLGAIYDKVVLEPAPAPPDQPTG